MVIFLQAGQDGKEFADHAIRTWVQENSSEFQKSVATNSAILAVCFSKFAVDPINDGAGDAAGMPQFDGGNKLLT